MKVGLVQMIVTDDKSGNVMKAIEHIEKLADSGAEVVILPEMFNCPYDISLFKEYGEKEGGETFQMLSKIAKEREILLIGGSIPEIDDGKVYNTSYVFDEAGDLIAKHRKYHLFDIDIPGGITFKESETLTQGNKLTIFNTRYGKFGLMICFDLRFAEDIACLKEEGVDVLIVPGAFNQVTGPLHWELLFRARANDLQCYSVGVAPARHGQGYQSYGHSIVCNSMGEVIYQAGYEEVLRLVEIDTTTSMKTRKNIPINNKV